MSRGYDTDNDSFSMVDAPEAELESSFEPRQSTRQRTAETSFPEISTLFDMLVIENQQKDVFVFVKRQLKSRWDNSFVTKGISGRSTLK